MDMLTYMGVMYNQNTSCSQSIWSKKSEPMAGGITEISALAPSSSKGLWPSGRTPGSYIQLSTTSSHLPRTARYPTPRPQEAAGGSRQPTYTVGSTVTRGFS